MAYTEADKPKDNKCVKCRIDLGSGYMIFYPELCLSCVLDEHIKATDESNKAKELKWKQEELLNTFKEVNRYK